MLYEYLVYEGFHQKTVMKISRICDCSRSLVDYSLRREFYFITSCHVYLLLQLECTHQTLVMFAGHAAAYYCFGRLLYTFVQGWDDYEKVKAFNLIQTIAK